MLPVKSEPQVSNELDRDELDHMCLGDRMKLLRRRNDDSELKMPRGYECLKKFELDHMCLGDRMKLLRTGDECLKKFLPCVVNCTSAVPESAKATGVNRSRKRKKTATDSVKTALEEDAPGLLLELVGKGISVDEIKLYGEIESDEAIEESFSEDNFTELEAVISKLFTQRHSFFKLSPLQNSKGARANYCLACLFSLVEQTRYLQFKKWPVEWGWCRDLQSFIFVFERHNRLVLERPEYGYATYFFELVDSLPLDWQIKRLVTAMKLTGCSRMSLIENKPLVNGSIGEAFERHEQKLDNLQKVNSWRAACTEVSNLAGEHLQDDRNEAKFIEDFIKVVSSKLDDPLLNVSKDLVGMVSRLEKLESCVSESPDVRFIGICGMGGLGTTTLASAYFEYFSDQFEACSFLANVREVCEKEGLVKLQKQLLADILKVEHIISDVYNGKGMIRRRLCGKKVLVILHDVNQLNQLERLAEENNWFAYGSRIIVTTRNEDLLSMYGEEGYIIHRVDKLEDPEAVHPFSSKAFRSDCPPEDYRELSEEVMKYANGLPLALVVLGSLLLKKSLKEWKSALERLKEVPEEEIMKKLQISFDALKETEKRIFLDIACFFNGFRKDYIMEIMNSCGFFPKIGIRSLVDKSLLHIDKNDKLLMHDLLEEMG